MSSKKPWTQWVPDEDLELIFSVAASKNNQVQSSSRAAIHIQLFNPTRQPYHTY